MRKYFFIAALLLVAVSIGALVARNLGFYNSYWYTDVILHTISGVAIGYLWLGLNHGKEKRKWMVILNASSFAVLGSLVWELWEFAGWQITPSHLRFYIPELGDTLGDICNGFVGGLISALLTSINIKRDGK